MCIDRWIEKPPLIGRCVDCVQLAVYEFYQGGGFVVVVSCVMGEVTEMG